MKKTAREILFEALLRYDTTHNNFYDIIDDALEKLRRLLPKKKPEWNDLYKPPKLIKKNVGFNACRKEVMEALK